MIGRAALFLGTVRHLQPGQILTRVSRLAERAWWRVAKPTVRAGNALPRREHVPLWRFDSIDAAAVARAKDVVEGCYTFLNVIRVRPSWSIADVPRLWRFHLHSFEYLQDLAVLAAAGERADAFAAFRERSESWMAAHRFFGGDGWHPYTVSLRIVNWCEAAVAFHSELESDRAFAAGLVDSIAAQARFLSRHLETDVRGNHILENTRALVRASVFFAGPEADRWMEIALRILRREVPEQILSDGGHFERAPGYHLRVMRVLEDTARLLRANALPELWLDEAVERMRRFLDFIVPASGRLPLLKDTVLPGKPIATRGPQTSRWLAESGFAVMRDDACGDHLIADFGRVCPDYLPAHAHADMFSFELTIGGRPMVVDSGVFEYESGEWRQWFRSTAAHNTVSIDHRDQSEMWGSFRVGRRARPRDVVWIDQPDFTAVGGAHDAYAPLAHARWIVAVKQARLWIVVDRVMGPRGHVARSFLHLHPGAVLPGFASLGASTERLRGWYSEAFGAKGENEIVALTAATPCWFGYVIGAEQVTAAMNAGSDACRIEVAAASSLVELSVTGEGALSLARR
jgi:uncharacterized heparinase superfamily protein